MFNIIHLSGLSKLCHVSGVSYKHLASEAVTQGAGQGAQLRDVLRQKWCNLYLRANAPAEKQGIWEMHLSVPDPAQRQPASPRAYGQSSNGTTIETVLVCLFLLSVLRIN